MNYKKKFIYLDTEVFKSYDKTKVMEAITLSELRTLCAEKVLATYISRMITGRVGKEKFVFIDRPT